MKKLSSLIILLFLSIIYSNAQVRNIDVDKLKWDVSIDMYNIFNGYPKLMVRKLNKNGAYRFLIEQSQFSKSLRTFYAGQNIPTRGQSSNLGIALGYEFHNNIGRKQIYYGLDFGYNRSSWKSDIATIGPQTNNIFEVAPLIGIKYQIISELSLSIESKLPFNYSILKNLDQNNTLLDKTSNYSIYFQPLSRLNLSYHF